MNEGPGEALQESLLCEAQAPQDTTGWFRALLKPHEDLLLKTSHFLYRENKTQAKLGNPAIQKDLKQEDQTWRSAWGYRMNSRTTEASW